MSNSPLVTCTRLCSNCNAPRSCSISKITLHHMAGVMTAQRALDVQFAPGREMSANYFLGYDCSVGLGVEECNRAWTSSSPYNDHRAITIEVSNSAYGGNWPVSDQVINKLIELMVDICRRNGIDRLVYTGNGDGSLTLHKDVASPSCPTMCPGPYLTSKVPEIAARVNAILGGCCATPTPVIQPNNGRIKKGDVVTISQNATYYNGSSVPQWVKNDKWIVSQVDDSRAVLGQNLDKTRDIQSPMSTSYLTTVEASAPVTCDPTPAASGPIQKGSLVTITGSTYYNGVGIPSWVKADKWYVDQINGDRAVLGRNEDNTRNIQSPISVSYLRTDAVPEAPKSNVYTKALKAVDKIYKNPDGKECVGNVGVNGVFTIVQEVSNDGVVYGKLKSGAGYVVLSGTVKSDAPIAVGDTVKVYNNKQYNGNTFCILVPTYKVLEISGDRVVLSADGKNVTVAVNINNCEKV